MKPLLALRPSWRALSVAAALAVVALLVSNPGWGLPTGMDKDTQIYPPDFEKVGCTSCHGTKAQFWPDSGNDLQVTIHDATGAAPPGMVYAKGAVYTINITLGNEQAPTLANHAGFNIRASSGKFSVPAGSTDVQTSKDSSQATHTNAEHTKWTVTWTAPDAGAVHFVILVNDVNGINGNDPGDHVYQTFMDLTDAEGAQLGAAVKVVAPEFGISLQQYWIGLIGLFVMIIVMVAGFVYLKFVNPHNADQKDR
ncbi:MAG: hypothetical protein LC620_07150 [Halobacteriales archaeon]|nr:hypothetical protein [Halobacteriales archaeon]